ncbi:mCG145140, partial [Mus musculus]
AFGLSWEDPERMTWPEDCPILHEEGRMSLTLHPECQLHFHPVLKKYHAHPDSPGQTNTVETHWMHSEGSLIMKNEMPSSICRKMLRVP